jgi:hypothetical protein
MELSRADASNELPSRPLEQAKGADLFVFTRRRLLSLATIPAAIALAPVAVRASPRPIAEESFVPIGGIEQWVAIRGRKRSRLPILFLHGGPCEAQSPLLSLFAPWEERYVVALDSDVSRLIG